MTDEPRILDEVAARAYLGGRNPRLIMPPVKIGGRNCWDRVALDRRLDELFGITTTGNELQLSALEHWRRNRKITAGDAEAEELGKRFDAMLEGDTSPTDDGRPRKL